jgi:hypothetical protein
LIRILELNSILPLDNQDGIYGFWAGWRRGKQIIILAIFTKSPFCIHKFFTIAGYDGDHPIRIRRCKNDRIETAFQANPA